MTEKPYTCPKPDVFDWYITKIKLMALENRGKGKCERLVGILQNTIKDLRRLQESRFEDPCADEEYEQCEDRCVPVGMCEILEGDLPPRG